MRLTINLEPDLYALAKSLAREDDCSISAAVNRLLRRSFTTPSGSGARQRTRNSFVVSPGKHPVTRDTVRRIEAEDDVR